LGKREGMGGKGVGEGVGKGGEDGREEEG